MAPVAHKRMHEHKDISEESSWKGYVSNRPDKEDILGPGVVSAEWRFLGVKDPNAQQIKDNHGRDVSANRFDMILVRAGGRCVRLHPESGQHEKPIDGKMSD